MELKEATASFKKGDMAAMEYHENVLKQAFGSELPEMLPSILKALPPDRAAALKAVTEVQIPAHPHARLRLRVPNTSSTYRVFFSADRFIRRTMMVTCLSC